MKQYHEILNTILEKGSYKEPAREGMPGTTSYFGHQFRHDLSTGFPLLTTKKMFWKGVVVELIWFLKGDTNVKYLIDNGCNIWNEDAYNFYSKTCSEQGISEKLSFDQFVQYIKELDSDRSCNKTDDLNGWKMPNDYVLGDCGFQYGRVWREWQKFTKDNNPPFSFEERPVDQIRNVINSIQKSPYSRRHLVTAIDPSNEDNLALYWCHAMFQFNCRKAKLDERISFALKNLSNLPDQHLDWTNDLLDEFNIPKYLLDCQLFQRSADVFLGVPFNIASYALLNHIIAKICNMIPGDFIHTFGDVHIYDNHLDAVREQLSRDTNKYELPSLKINGDWDSFDSFLSCIEKNDWKDIFEIINYQSYPTIKAELSTGLKK